MAHRFRTASKATKIIYRTREHRTARQTLIARFHPGDPCCLCGHPMLTTRYLEADHLPGTHTYRGLAHGARHPCQTCGKRCNSSDGARRGAHAANRQTQPRPRTVTRRQLLG